MDWEHSYLDYYPQDDAVFIDPMYAIYQRVNVPLDNQCYLPVNTAEDMGNPNFIDESVYRREWNNDFAVLNPLDPAPAGWSKVYNTNYRTKIEEEGTRNGTFYTDKDWRVKYQYFDGYTVNRLNPNNLKKRYPDDSPTWKSESLNPQTGNWVLYKQTLPQQRLNKYGALPSRSSYLGH